MKDPTILVVEDEIPLLDAIRMRLEKHDFLVLTARSVQQAEMHIQDVEEVDAIWLDHYLLGKEDGLDFVARCREEGSICKNIPIFVVSNTASEQKVKTYLQLGVQEYFVKAEKRLDDIIQAIKTTLEERKKENVE